MNGCIIRDTPIAVDFWQIRQKPELKIFFLSHMHSDHTKGLSASWRRIIYCSPVTAKLAASKLRVPASLLKPLEVGQSHIIQIDETGQETMTVSLIDANHCPGAVMFLFEGYFGRILYTGDFRFKPSMITDSILANCGAIDRLFLDNTYNNAKCVLPSRAECRERIIEIIKRYPAYEIVIGMHKLGKEELLVDIALAFKMKIVVSPDQMRTLKILEMPDVFTTDSSESRIRTVPSHLVTKKNMAKWQEGSPTIAILPTALYTSLEMQPFANQPDIHIVPYSDHSSYSELIEFVSRIKPKQITPVVEDARIVTGINNVSNFDRFLSKSNDSGNIIIPESVLSFMKSGSVSSTQSLAQICIGGDASQTKSRRIKRLQSLKKSTRGVVFDDKGDEDTEEEMKRRKLCEDRLQSASGTDEDADKQKSSSPTMQKEADKCKPSSQLSREEAYTHMKASYPTAQAVTDKHQPSSSTIQKDIFHQNHKGCNLQPENSNQRDTSDSIKQQPNDEASKTTADFNTEVRQSSKQILFEWAKPRSSIGENTLKQTGEKSRGGLHDSDNVDKQTEIEIVGAWKLCNKSTTGQGSSLKPPAKRKLSVVSDVTNPPAKKKMDVLTMLRLSAEKRRALKESAQNNSDDIIEVIDEPSLVECKPKSKDGTDENVSCERIPISDDTLNKLDKSVFDDAMFSSGEIATSDTSSTCKGRYTLSTIESESKSNKSRTNQVCPGNKSQNDQSRFLKLPCSVRKVERRKRIAVGKIFQQFLEK